MRPREINETSLAFAYLQRPLRSITVDVTVQGMVLLNCLHNRFCVWTTFAIPASHRTIRSIQSFRGFFFRDRTIRSIQSFRGFFRGHGQDAKFSGWMGWAVKELGRGG
jgi:hypothetical protein